MRVLVASSNPWSFSLAVERHLVRQHPGDTVDLLNLFDLCSSYSPHWTTRDRLIERLNRKIPRFLRPLINGQDITSAVRRALAPPPVPPVGKFDLRNYAIGPAKVGLGILSSVAQDTTLLFPERVEDYGGAFESAWRSAHLSVQIADLIAQYDYDRIYTFGGRHCWARPFCDILEETSEVVKYEQGGTGHSYVSASDSVYEPQRLAQIIREQRFDQAEAVQFFEERIQRAETSDATFFTSRQTVGALPPFLMGKPLISFFTSSVDEIFAIREEYGFGKFANQYEVALAAAQICQQNGKILVVRLHPHLMFKHQSWRTEWNFAELSRLGAVVLPPEDEADTYALLRASEGVLTCGSTVGFESAYLQIPNAVVGEWLSGVLGASTLILNLQDLRGFMKSPSSPPGAKEKALLFGSYHRVGGCPVSGLEYRGHPNFTRLDGRIVDPIRYSVQRFREIVSGGRLENASGIQGGKVMFPSGERYRSA